jgi:hypothetical protein
MNDDRLYLDAEIVEDRGLMDSLSVVRGISELRGSGEACARHPERESLVWAYADGFLTEAEEAAAWEALSECRYCLDRLAAVQRALGEAEVWLRAKNPDPTTVTKLIEQMKKAWEQKDWHKVLAIYPQVLEKAPNFADIRAWFKEAVQALLPQSDFILAPVLTHGSIEILKPKLRRVMGRRIIRISRGQYELTVESRLRRSLCDLDITIRYQDKPGSGIEISLYDYETGLVQGSQAASERGRVLVTGLKTGQYLLLLNPTGEQQVELFTFEIQDDDGQG